MWQTAGMNVLFSFDDRKNLNFLTLIYLNFQKEFFCLKQMGIDHVMWLDLKHFEKFSGFKLLFVDIFKLKRMK